jgi:hypothetical protein
MSHGLALFYEATPDDKNILVHIEQPIRKPRSQLVGQPRLQSTSRSIGGRQPLDAVPDFGDCHPAQIQAGRGLTICPRFDLGIAIRLTQLRDYVCV